jgi:iron complex transport system ATP-binding protein
MSLTADNVHVRLGDKNVLTAVTAAIAPGQVTAIIGPNGAGKSTLLACLAGLRAPDKGQVNLAETPILSVPARQRARQIGFLPQVPEVAWAVEARTLVGLGRTPFIGARGLSHEDEAAVDRALAATAATELEHRNFMTLSGGERARVLIARALAGEPQWLLADEPLTGLDPGFQLDAADLFRRLAHQDGRGIVITLHDLHMALRVADRIIVLVAGQVLADGPPAEALSPDVLAQAYGVEARFAVGKHGPLIDILGRRAS